MTGSDKENIERKLNHVLDMGKMIIDLYRHITCTERVGLMLAMTAAVRQVAANMRTIAALLRQNLLDPFGIDYTDYARKIENLQKIWCEDLMGAPIVHNLDTLSRPITNPSEIALKEDSEYNFVIRTEAEDSFDFFETRVGLMNNAPLMCEAIDTGLEQLGNVLRVIVDDYLQLKGDRERQDECLRKLEEQYEDAMWAEDKERLINEVREFEVLCNNSREKATYDLFKLRLEREATDPHDIKVLAELNERYLDGQRPAAFIVENRDKLTMEDVARHFRFVRCRKLLIRHIERFDLLKPADEEYSILFVNKAAQELAILLKPTIAITVDFRYDYQYAALQMAMQDLGLIYCEKNNGLQMMKYINSVYKPKDEQIKDQTTLTKWTGKLLGHKFGMMDENNLIGNYDNTDFEKLKDRYWLCISIINKVVGRDLRELGFATYLYKEHERTPSISDYRNIEGQSIMERLAEIKSVIRGETLF